VAIAVQGTIRMNFGKRLLCLFSSLVLVPSVFAQATDAGASNHLAAALANLDPYIKASMATTKVPGLSIAVVYHDKVLFLKGYGVRKIGEPARVDADTIFEIASFSKPVSTTVVAAVVGSGQVSWDTPIKQLDPSFELSNASITEQVTVRDLLSHRSTLPTDAGDSLETLGYARPEILHQMRLVPLNGVFRETYQYTNFGITEGALAAVRPLHLQWEDAAEELLYRKLGMDRTSSRFSDYLDRPNRASLHYLDADGKFYNWFVREADPQAPAGGVNSTARDLAQWLRLQLAGGEYNGQQIVDRAALEETHKPQVCQKVDFTPSGPTCPNKLWYGLGWDVAFRPSGEPVVSHSGAFLSGAGTTVYMIPSLDIGILVLTNGAPVGLAEAVSLNFLDIFEYGAPQHDYIPYVTPTFNALRDGAINSSKNYGALKPPSNPSPGPDTSTLLGTYSNPYFGKVEVVERQGKFVLRLPVLGTYYELSHWDGNTWTYYLGNELSGATRRGVELDGNTVCIENLKAAYNPVFTRVQ
jgi:CubicO group peptidase (beta-lactamase class C family)